MVELTETGNRKIKRKGTRFQRCRAARILAVQAVFEANYREVVYLQILKEFLATRIIDNEHPVVIEQALFISLLDNLTHNIIKINEDINKLIAKKNINKNLDPVLKAILQLGISELYIPYKNTQAIITIKEYVEIGKGFLTSKESGYINKVLDILYKQITAANKQI